MKSNHQCRACGRWLEGEFNAIPDSDSPQQVELQRQMDQGHCDDCTPPPSSLVHHIVQKAYNIWDDLRWAHNNRSDWQWLVTPEALEMLRKHRWEPPDPTDLRYPPGYTGPTRADPDRSNWTLFGIPIGPNPQPMNHNQIELRIRQ